MRDRTEVENAIRHLREALSSPLAQSPGQGPFRYLTRIQIELLTWAMGEENSFSELILQMEGVDRMKRAQRQ